MAILVTGGTGFIGSHTCIALTEAGYDAVIVDNYYNSSPKSLERINELCGKELKFYECDIRNREGMTRVFKENKIDAVPFRGAQSGGRILPKADGIL